LEIGKGKMETGNWGKRDVGSMKRFTTEFAESTEIGKFGERGKF
jgi:hypothetical protein